MVDERDGQTYRTVKIGIQIWMVENEYQPSAVCENDENCRYYGRYYSGQ
ncbi:FISUMP domain-containing protein [Fibrobacter intestinalis]|nr:FISUMP domain-containing protein [uncultured Fibrobacter sp.]